MSMLGDVYFIWVCSEDRFGFSSNNPELQESAIPKNVENNHAVFQYIIFNMLTIDFSDEIRGTNTKGSIVVNKQNSSKY